jgi:ubiquinone/menaquinone biosynthesis C-methylase UbiE
MAQGLFEECEAIDIAEPAILVLKERIKEEKINNLNAFCSNIMATKYANDSFDCVFGNSFLHHLPDNEIFLKETFRILKEGGTICFTSEPTPSGSILEGFFSKNLLELLQFLKLKPKPAQLSSNLSDIWLYEKESLEAMLKQVGFETIKIKGFGFLTPLFNIPSSIIFKKISKKSMQPDWWWNIFSTLDKVFFFWLPTSVYSHVTICARKPHTHA